MGEPVPAYTKTSVKHDYGGSETIWGYAKFIRRKELEKSALVKDGIFRISCHVTVFDIRTESTPVRFPAAPSTTDLHRDLGDLLETKLGADVQFKVGRKTFSAHRSVLAARSPVFKAMLFSTLNKDNKAAQFRIHDMEARVFAAMLHFVYTDSLPPIDEADTTVMSLHLVDAADRFRLEGLKMICEDVLRNCIDADTAAMTEQHGRRRLKVGCFNFLKYRGHTWL